MVSVTNDGSKLCLAFASKILHKTSPPKRSPLRCMLPALQNDELYLSVQKISKYPKITPYSTMSLSLCCDTKLCYNDAIHAAETLVRERQIKKDTSHPYITNKDPKTN